MRFSTSIRRILPFISYHHILIMSLLGSIILYSLVLAACTSSASSILSIYLLSLTYHPTDIGPSASQLVNQNLTNAFKSVVGNASLSVRAGYFSLCVSNAGGIWVCSTDTAALARQFTADQDPLNLIWAGAKFKDGIVFGGLIIAAIALSAITIVILLTFPGWHEETDEHGSDRDVKPFPSRPMSQIALAASTLASLLALVSMLWQHTASVAAATTAQDMAYGTVKSEVGAAAMAMGWVGLALVVVPAIGLAVMIQSIRLLDHLTEE